MPKYQVKMTKPDGTPEDWGIWEYNVDEEQLWAMVSYSYKEEHGRYPDDGEITLIGDDDVV